VQKETSSIVPSGYFGTDSSNILVLDNIFSDELCDTIYDFLINNDDIWNDSDTSDQTSYDFWSGRLCLMTYFKDKDFYPELQERVKVLIGYIEKKFNVVIEAKKISLNFVRWPDGSSQAPHGDKENEDGSLQISEIRNYDLSTIIYINDNFDGGNTYFTQHDISIKPKKGSVLIFPGDRHYIHGVSEVTNGTRYTLPKFWTVSKMI
jgi:hypothetical protein